MKNQALKILKRLKEAGHQAFWVGGCVRDLLMGQEPKDYDIATSAKPEEVMSLFPRTLAVGAQFGVIICLEESCQVEVSTFRSDGIYLDGRRPCQVTFSTDPREDVIRRDFTINGLLYDPCDEKVIDYVNGQSDLQQGIIRAIGKPRQRFREDRLRMMRALRFAARFHFQIEPATRQAILEESRQIAEVSAERIRDELLHILCEGYAASGITLLEETGLLDVLLPEVTAMRGIPQPPEYHPEGDVWQHTLLVLKFIDRTKNGKSRPANSQMTALEYPGSTLAMGAFLHDIGKPRTFQRQDRIRFNRHAEVGAGLAAEICSRLRFSNRQQQRIVALVRDHLRFIDMPKMKLSTLKRFLRQEGFEEHLELHRLDCLASHGNLDNWNQAREWLQQMEPELIRPPRLLTGHDLLEIGYSRGPLFQRILQQVEDAQLEGLLRSKEEAKSFVKDRFRIDEASTGIGQTGKHARTT
jgi:poly(A) polymerase